MQQELSGVLSCAGLVNAEIFVIKDVQNTAFDEETELLHSGNLLPSGHHLNVLSPFLDEKDCSLLKTSLFHRNVTILLIMNM